MSDYERKEYHIGLDTSSHHHRTVGLERQTYHHQPNMKIPVHNPENRIQTEENHRKQCHQIVGIHKANSKQYPQILEPTCIDAPRFQISRPFYA